MNRIREIYSRLKRDQKYASWFQFIKFGLVGVSNTLISLAIYYLVICINQNWYIVGNTLGWVVGVANAFFWNNRIVSNLLIPA
jgi:putative flippase GtrA